MMLKSFTLLGFVAALSFSTAAIADEYVQGYTRANGTYVQGYYRTSPNGTTLDNYSTKGNVNPYTGQPGTRNPYPTYSTPSYTNPYQQQQSTDPNNPN